MRLLPLAIGFALGAITAGVAAVLLVPHWYYEIGHYHGEIEVGWKIPDALGRDVDPNEPKQWFSATKDEGVFVVTRHGVKTLRLCCDGTEPKPTP
jgi:hypothetical protein